MTQQPDLTVVVPTRGRPELVRAAVRSVVHQDYAGRIECLVVHDQEARQSDLTSLQSPGREVRVLQNTRAPGLAGSRNTGVALATSPLVASCDDDDTWLPAKVTRQVALLTSRPGMSVVGAGIRLLMPGGRVVDWNGPHPVVTHADLLRSRRKELHSSTLLMRREVFDRVGGYDEQLPHGYAEDYEWLLRASRLGPIGVVQDPLALIRKDGQSWFRERAEVTAVALEQLLRTHPELASTRRGHARVLGQIAFAHATAGDRRTASRWLGRSMARWPLAPQALLTAGHLVLRVDPRTLLSSARLVGRGLS